MAKKSALHCLRLSRENEIGTDEDLMETDHYKDLDKCPCKIFVMDPALNDTMRTCFDNITKDGFSASIYIGESAPVKPSTIQAASPSAAALNAVAVAMRKTGHALHRGGIYYRFEKGQLF